MKFVGEEMSVVIFIGFLVVIKGCAKAERDYQITSASKTTYKKEKKMKIIFLGEEVELPEEILVPENNSCIAFSGDVINGNGYFSDSSENLCNLLEEIGIEKSLEFLKELKNRMVIPSLGNLLAFIAFKKDGVDKREETRVRTEKLNETTKALDLLIEVLEKNK